MTAILGRLGALVGFTTGRGTTPWNTEMEASLRKMDAMVATTAIAITNTLPASANEGDLYLVGTAPTGVAAGWANRVARWKAAPAGWEAYQPMQGWIITIVGESTNKVRRYNGTAWVPLITDIGAEPALPAGGTANDYLTGAKAWTNFAAAVRSAVLTGLSTASSAVVTATDTVLQAIGKLQAQIAACLPKNDPIFTGTMYGSGAVTWRDSSGLQYFAIRGMATDWVLRALNDDGSTASYPIVVLRAAGGTIKLGVTADTRPVEIGGNLTFGINTASVLYQGAAPRITAGGGGRFTEVRLSGLVGSAGYLPRLDANGELIASGILEDLGDLGGASGLRTALSRPLKLNQAGGSWGGSSYSSWTPSAYLPISDDSLGNDISGTRSGWLWNSQRINAITICDGAASTPYRGRLRAERWFAYSTLLVQNTTTATSWFAGGTGDGSATIPANYLKPGRRVNIRGRLICSSCVADTNPEIAFKIGSTVVWTQAKGFTIAAGNEIIVDVEIVMFIDSDGNLIVLSDCEFFSYLTGTYRIPRGNAIAAFDATTAKAIDLTLKPSSTSEIWVRSIALIEI